MPLYDVDRAAIEAVLTRQSAAWVAGDAGVTARTEIEPLRLVCR